MLRRGLARLLIPAIAGLGACAPADRSAMVRLPPPRDWLQQTAEHREARDDLFGSSPETPLLVEDRASFDGLDYWPPDPAYYFVGPIHAYERPERFRIVTSAGQERPCEKVGWVRFPLGSTLQTLQVYRLLDLGADAAGSLLLAFRDGTSGSETYPAGRYVDLVGPAGGPYVLDFNRAYNPSCAYGDPQRFACPMPPPENWLDAPIRAGERGYHHEPDTPATAGS